MIKSTNAYEEKEEEFRDQLKRENDLYEESDVNKNPSDHSRWEDDQNIILE